MLLQSQFDSLPYIENEVNEFLELAREEIQKSVDISPDSYLHPLIQQHLPLTKSLLTESLQQELSKYESGQQTKLQGGVDLSKYTDLQDPETGDLKTPDAYIALGYSHIRQENLSLLSEFGKNQWLISNDQLEKQLKSIEQQLVDVKQKTDFVNNERKRKQSELEPTLNYLQKRWKDSVKGLVDVNVANLKLEREIKQLRGE